MSDAEKERIELESALNEHFSVYFNELLVATKKSRLTGISHGEVLFLKSIKVDKYWAYYNRVIFEFYSVSDNATKIVQKAPKGFTLQKQVTCISSYIKSQLFFVDQIGKSNKRNIGTKFEEIKMKELEPKNEP